LSERSDKEGLHLVMKRFVGVQKGRILADSSVHVVLNAGKIGGKLVCKGGKKIPSRAAFRMLAREKERSRKPFLDNRWLCDFQTSHHFSYSECNGRLSNARRSMQPNDSTLFLVI
jgi:hypothetical protein